MPTISTERKAELQDAGFYVEDMGQEHGKEFEGQFRWMNSVTQDFQDYDTCDSEDAAWYEASMYATETASA